MAYTHKWSPISYRSSAGQRKFAGQRPTFCSCVTHQPSSFLLSPEAQAVLLISVDTGFLCVSVQLCINSNGWHPGGWSVSCVLWQQLEALHWWRLTVCVVTSLCEDAANLLTLTACVFFQLLSYYFLVTITDIVKTFPATITVTVIWCLFFQLLLEFSYSYYSPKIHWYYVSSDKSAALDS